MPENRFNAGEPLGYFITWTAYGTWLPGDERGWQRKRQGDPLAPNELFREMAVSSMKDTAFFLTDEDRQVVEDTIRKHCKIRDWVLHSVSARTNHVHIVVTAPGYAPEIVRDQLKAWCTRTLKPRHVGRERFWTEGASRRYLNTADDLDSAIEYVDEAQDRKSREC